MLNVLNHHLKPLRVLYTFTSYIIYHICNRENVLSAAPWLYHLESSKFLTFKFSKNVATNNKKRNYELQPLVKYIMEHKT